MTIEERYSAAFFLAGFEKADLPQNSMATVAFRNKNTNEIYGFDGWHLAGFFLEENDFIFSNVSDKEKFEELLYPDRIIKYFVSINEDYAEFNELQDALAFYDDADYAYARTFGAVIENSKVVVSEYNSLKGFSIDNKPLAHLVNEDTEITSHELDLIEETRRNVINPQLKKYNQYLDLCFYIHGLFEYAKENVKKGWNGPESWQGVYANKQYAPDYLDIQISFVEPEKISLSFTSVLKNQATDLLMDEVLVENINEGVGLFDLLPQLEENLKQMFERYYVYEQPVFSFYSLWGGEDMNDFYERLNDKNFQYPPDFSSVKYIQKDVPEDQQKITFTVAEVADFHDMGELHEDIESTEEAIRIYNQIPPERMRGLRSIGIKLHGNEDNVDSQVDLYIEGAFCLDNLDFCPDISNNPKAWELINELREKMPLENILSSTVIPETLMNEEIDEESVQEFEESFRFSDVSEESKEDFNKIIDSVSEHIVQLGSLMNELKSKADIMNTGRIEDSNFMAVRQKNGR